MTPVEFMCLAGLVTLVAGPVLILRLHYGARWSSFLLGIISFLIAWFLKLIPGLLLGESVLLGGVFSAVAELGAAALFLRPRMRGADVLAFGAGIGCFEVVMKTAMGVAGAAEPGGAAAAAPLLLSLVENVVTVVGHTATRVLVYVTKSGRRLLPAAIALTTFSLVDGTATYGHMEGWDWGSVAVYGPFVLFLTVVAAVEAASAAWYWRRVSSRPAP